MIIESNTPVVIAHRGASGYRPEHTRAAFELAIALGADAVEPDLVVSSDGVLVIRHENEISGTTDVAARPEFAARRATRVVDGETLTGWFTEDFTWAELSTLRARERLADIRPLNAVVDFTEPILRLEDLLELLDAAGRQVGLVAEVKHATYFRGLGVHIDELLGEALVRAGWNGDPRLTIESFELTVLGRLRSAGVVARMIYLVEAEGAPADRPDWRYAQALTAPGLAFLASAVDGISVPKSLILDPDAHRTRDLVFRAHAAGLLVFCWTLRPENLFLAERNRTGDDAAFGDWRAEFAQVFASGVDGVFADHPDLALAALGVAGTNSAPGA